MNPKPTQWCCVPVVVDDDTAELFLMTTPDEDPEQCMEFRVTQSTADLVPLDFERYQPSLQRMVDDWRRQKARVMQMKLRKATPGSLAADATAINS